MKRRNFVKILGVFAFLLSITGIFSLNEQPVTAQTTPSLSTFTMQLGASVRVKTLVDEEGNEIESNGLRFSAQISEDEYTKLKEAGARFGAVIVAKDLLKTTQINESTVFGSNPAFYFSNETNNGGTKIPMLHVANAGCENIDEDPELEISGSLVDILVDNFTRSFVGRVYVAIPTINANGETTYTYHFAPYYEGEIANSTRCVYYVAQRAIEDESEIASFVQEKYITPFEDTSRYKDYVYRYYVNHHYIVHDGDKHSILHTKQVACYGQLNSVVQAPLIEKPDDVPELKDMNFIYDIDRSSETNMGLVYAAGMLTLDVYYEKAEDLSEEKKEHTLEAVLANFLNPDNASHNFGLQMQEEGGPWSAAKVTEDGTEDGVQIGIALHTTQPNGTDGRTIILSKVFFEDLRAYGVTCMTFNLHTEEGSNKKISYNVYQEEEIDGDTVRLPVYDSTGKKITGTVTVHQITIYLDDVTRGGGVTIVIDPSSTSNTGTFHLGSVQFGFDPKPSSLQ